MQNPHEPEEECLNENEEKHHIYVIFVMILREPARFPIQKVK